MVDELLAYLDAEGSECRRVNAATSLHSGPCFPLTGLHSLSACPPACFTHPLLRFSALRSFCSLRSHHSHAHDQTVPLDAREWYKRNLDHNTPGGKLNRGMSVVDTVEIVLCTDTNGKKVRELSEPEYLKAAILGWCVELVSWSAVAACASLEAAQKGRVCCEASGISRSNTWSSALPAWAWLPGSRGQPPDLPVDIRADGAKRGSYRTIWRPPTPLLSLRMGA